MKLIIKKLSQQKINKDEFLISDIEPDDAIGILMCICEVF